ncbi:MotA/TolQ/ExbB proton channel family protein, partial [Myxococcota bacterium]|nr:MotA/TolQ/ExbB proton channel family protein [Myxococcota bacterium]
MKFLKDWKTNRMFLIASGIGVSVLLIALLTAILSRGSTLAKLLIDFQEEGSSLFPYPLTIQNIMWVMFGVAIGDALYRHHSANNERASIELGLLPESHNAIITKENLPELMEKSYVYRQKHGYFLARLIHSAGMSFQTHSSAEQAHEVMSSQVDIELHRSDLRYTLLRYIAWLLPTLGFIGTVVGISASLSSIEVGNKTQMQQSEKMEGEQATKKNSTIQKSSTDDVTS